MHPQLADYDYHICFAGPFVTSVGGATSQLPEVAAPLSAGGFSNYFSRPDYQDAVVPLFLQNLGHKYQGFYKCVNPVIRNRT